MELARALAFKITSVIRTVAVVQNAYKTPNVIAQERVLIIDVLILALEYAEVRILLDFFRSTILTLKWPFFLNASVSFQ